ncbi:MAG TPA: recombinase zinc beta ribbon domain-containing protein [Candidatus Caccovivens faecavium]|nr:recombinase zinc beta ribbon domain-containing protein [Candidatus Caccovivens faecavium]
MKDIIADLTTKHILNHGRPFARNTIYNILKNEKYSGIYRFNNQTFENMYPQIVSTEIYEKVRQKTNQNKYGKRSVEVVYLLRNKLKCGYCGEPISAECGTTSQGKKRRYYKCLGKKRHTTNCNKQTLRKEILENFVIDILLKELNKPQTIEKNNN